jgi:hypothetical protein
MKKAAQRALLVIVLGGGSLLTMAWAQEPAQKPADQAKPPSFSPDAPPAPPRAARRHGQARAFSFARPDDRSGFSFSGPGRSWGGHPMSEEEMQESEAMDQAVDKLKSAKNDADKTTATKEISQLLEKSFQHDMERRETQISEIEARVKKLREQIEKRKKAKDEIISLHLKTIVNEADGLGFPGRFDHESDLGPQGRSFQQWLGPDSARPEPLALPAPPHTPDSDAP